ncbi:(S)-ureidoglycine aminohydrolase [bacterium]|nr:MAG: (S)-ureidoglycine aminohydrolase [bacterium]
MDSKLFSRTGGTRTVLAPDHALIAPDGHVVSTLPSWSDTGGSNAKGVILISPAMGAKLAQTLVFLEPATTYYFEPSPGIEAIFYVMEGELECESDALRSGSFGFLPVGERLRFNAQSAAKIVVFEKRYAPKPGLSIPARRFGHADTIKGQPFMGDPDATLQVLFPETPEFDMAVNIFTYQPGATLPFAETHIMEHGLLMLDGMGIYRLNDSWYPVSAGDCIWMAPYCPQWFGALGKEPSRYIYYKDVNRDAMEAL